MIATPVVIGLGGNVGDVLAAFRQALVALDQSDGVRVVAVSSLLKTAPVGGPEQDDFFNAAALLRVALDPPALHRILLAVEQAAARVRHERSGPRTLDLDVLWWDNRTIVSSDLVVPHPRLAERRFALQPLVELVPEAVAANGQRFADILAGLPAEGVEVVGGSTLVYDPS